VLKCGAGGAVLRDLPLAGRIIRAVIQRVGIPVTVKTRKGWDSNADTAVELARIAEDAGAKAVTIHGRTVKQGFGGCADWDVIRSVKDTVGIRVIGNGDVRSPEDAARMFDETGCDAVMVGRASQGNPWIFSRTDHYLRTGVLLPEPSNADRIAAARRHALLHVESLGEERGVRELRRPLACYIRGMRNAPRIRLLLGNARAICDIEKALDEARGER